MTEQQNVDADNAASHAAPYDVVGAIMDYENGEFDEEREIVELFQYLVDNGMAWQLQGSYGRTAKALIEAGLIDAS